MTLETPGKPYERQPRTAARRWERVLEYCLAHPGAWLYEIAAATGYGADHVGRIIRSPWFQARYETIRNAVLREIYLRRLTESREPSLRRRELRKEISKNMKKT